MTSYRKSLNEREKKKIMVKCCRKRKIKWKKRG
jgi:hypothetical protein